MFRRNIVQNGYPEVELAHTLDSDVKFRTIFIILPGNIFIVANLPYFLVWNQDLHFN